jgi:hypothetical protein
MGHRLNSILLLASIACGSGALAAEVDYIRDVKPLLKERCYACHGALKQQAGLRLDAGELIRKGGDSGPAVVPGDASSALVERISATDESLRMPPESRWRPIRSR